MRMLFSIVFFFACNQLGAPGANAIEPGLQSRTVAVAGAEYRYQVYVPSETPHSPSLTVILALHAEGGQRG